MREVQKNTQVIELVIPDSIPTWDSKRIAFNPFIDCQFVRVRPVLYEGLLVKSNNVFDEVKSRVLEKDRGYKRQSHYLPYDRDLVVGDGRSRRLRILYNKLLCRLDKDTVEAIWKQSRGRAFIPALPPHGHFWNYQRTNSSVSAGIEQYLAADESLRYEMVLAAPISSLLWNEAILDKSPGPRLLAALCFEFWDEDQGYRKSPEAILKIDPKIMAILQKCVAEMAVYEDFPIEPVDRIRFRVNPVVHPKVAAFRLAVNLGQSAGPVLPVLVEMLRNRPDPPVPDEYISDLIEVGAPAVVVFEEILQGDRHDVSNKRTAMHGVRQLLQKKSIAPDSLVPSTPSILAAVDNQDLREAAIMTLGAIGPVARDALPMLIRLRDDPGTSPVLQFQIRKTIDAVQKPAVEEPKGLSPMPLNARPVK